MNATDEYGRTVRSGNKTDDGDDKVINRIRKVLALTQSPNENEAAAAAARLSALLAEHNLSIADLESKGQAAPGVREQPHDLGKAAFKWKLDLADGIAEFYYCAPLVNRQTKTVAFIGRPDNVEALTMLYGWVIEQVKDIARDERRKHFDTTGEHIDPLRWQVGFGEGAVQRLIVRMKEMRARQQEDMARNQYGDITALAIHHSAEVSDYLEAKFGYRRDGRKTKAELEREERWARWDAEQDAERIAKDEFKLKCQQADEMETYYAQYPDERPEVLAKREAASQKRMRDWEKKEERNARRRTGNYREAKVDWAKEEQSSTARSAGRSAADRVNLQPFIGSGNKSKGGIN
jgi:hypothetical protein